MKRTSTHFVFILILFCVSAASAQMLKKSIQQLESAETVEELLNVEQNFTKMIADGKKLHEAYYYGALNNLFLAFKDTLRTDDYCARADKYLHKLDSLSPNN